MQFSEPHKVKNGREYPVGISYGYEQPCKKTRTVSSLCCCETYISLASKHVTHIISHTVNPNGYIYTIPGVSGWEIIQHGGGPHNTQL